jgi:cation diffusion facilitator CzcD-associated flavoprotein CzcO
LIGTGASAVQIGPELARMAATVHVFQRTAPWVVPRGDVPYTPFRRWLFRRIPGLRRLNRWRIYVRNEMLMPSFLGNKFLQKFIRLGGLRHLQRQVPDAALRAQLTPTGVPGCKRILLSDTWYPTLCQPHVALVTSSIVRITPTGVETADGQHHALDALVLATGFGLTGGLAHTQGRQALALGAQWRQAGAQTYLGLSTHGFPNMFGLLGPGSGLGSNSVLFILEAQLRYMVQAIKYLAKNGGALEVTAQAQAASYSQVQQRMPGTAWASGCSSWYQSANGTIDTIWPDFSFKYAQRTRHFDASVYNYTPPI